MCVNITLGWTHFLVGLKCYLTLWHMTERVKQFWYWTKPYQNSSLSMLEKILSLLFLPYFCRNLDRSCLDQNEGQFKKNKREITFDYYFHGHWFIAEKMLNCHWSIAIQKNQFSILGNIWPKHLRPWLRMESTFSLMSVPWKTIWNELPSSKHFSEYFSSMCLLATYWNWQLIIFQRYWSYIILLNNYINFQFVSILSKKPDIKDTEILRVC